MTDKTPIILGRGRLYFEDKLLGGTLTGRVPRDPIPAVLPSGEYIVPKEREVDLVGIDYGKVEARIMAHMTMPPAFVENLTQAVNGYFFAEWRRLERIGRLLASHDRRKVKRGRRLYDHFRATRLGGLGRYWKD